jgi:hypothetical protein
MSFEFIMMISPVQIGHVKREENGFASDMWAMGIIFCFCYVTLAHVTAKPPMA